MRTALAFLTRLPIGTPANPSLNQAAPFFPLVGLLVGALAAATRTGADQILPPLPSTLLALTAAVLITGALHEDGLADVADALGAHTTRERRLEILKDPRVGAFGALALILTTLLIATSVAALDTTEAAKTLIVAHVLAAHRDPPRLAPAPARQARRRRLAAARGHDEHADRRRRSGSPSRPPSHRSPSPPPRSPHSPRRSSSSTVSGASPATATGPPRSSPNWPSA